MPLASFGNYGNTLGAWHISDIDVRRVVHERTRAIENGVKAAFSDLSLRRTGAINDHFAIHGVPEAVELVGRMDAALDVVVPAAGKLLAGGLASDNSPWPYRTGYSRSRFQAVDSDQDSRINNDASYAGRVENEFYTQPAENFIKAHLQEAVDRIYDGMVGI